VAKDPSRIVLIAGQDSLRADRALAETLASRGADPAEVIRIWGDESSFADVFAAAMSRSLFSEKTVVVVRRAEKLRGAGKEESEEPDADGETEEAPEPVVTRKGGKAAAPVPDLPEFDASSLLILVARKADRRLGMWKKISKAGDVIDAEFLKGKALLMAASAEARSLGLRIPDDLLRDVVEQSGPGLGRIVSELEKMVLYQGGARESADGVAVTSAPPLDLRADALMVKDKARSLELLDEALRQGEAGLRVLATLHSTVRRLALFRTMRQSGLSAADAGAQLGIFPFKVADTDRAARSWSESELARALTVFAEADRRLKLSAPAVPLLTHAVAVIAAGGRL
jgi:DNA polymerase III delta subunit